MTSNRVTPNATETFNDSILSVIGNFAVFDIIFKSPFDIPIPSDPKTNPMGPIKSLTKIVSLAFSLIAIVGML